MKKSKNNQLVWIMEKRKGQILKLFMNQSELNFLSSSFTHTLSFLPFISPRLSAALRSWVTN